MKHRFETGERNHFVRNLLISVGFFLLILIVFRYAVGSVSSRAANEEKEILEQALTRSINHCYAIEGHYPESLEYLQENYGLTYDEDMFFVDYQPLGSDILPDVTIIVRKGEGK